MKITKCKGTKCPIKDNCLRFTAPRRDSSGTLKDVPYGEEEGRQVQTIKYIKHGCTWFVGNSHIKKKKS